ncbi:MAG: phosphoglucosamine mutase [Dethiobacteria bacterium]
MKKLFGTDGVRGVANRELTPEMAYRIGRICAFLMKREHTTSFIIVGKDTRKSGDMLESALNAGICSSGMDVLSVGVLPTPALAYLTRERGAAAGIMISASHNPIEDNGLKIFASSGFKLSDDMEAELENLYFNEDRLPRPKGGAIGKVEMDDDSINVYGRFLKEICPDLTGMHVAMDCAHGAAYKLAPELFSALGAKVTALNNTPSGTNINVRCGSTSPYLLQKTVKETGAMVGLAFDGDADRLIAVDEQGEIVDGDILMLIFSLYLQKKRRLKNSTLVATIMSNGGLDIAAEQNGFKVVRTAVGDRYVLEKMIEGGFNLGGEQSGHIIFSDYVTTGDGILTALQLTWIIREEGRKLSSYRTMLSRLPQVLVNCRVNRKDGWEENPVFKQALKEAHDKIGPCGRILIRPSGTEPVMRIMVEGEKDEAILHNLASELVSVLIRELNN